MKTFRILILMVVLLSSCGEDPGHKFSSIAGTWEFSDENISGEFQIKSNGSGTYSVAVGTFTQNGVEFTINMDSDVTENPLTGATEIVLQNSDGARIEFYDVVANFSNDKLTADGGYLYSDGVTFVEEPDKVISISRK